MFYVAVNVDDYFCFFKLPYSKKLAFVVLPNGLSPCTRRFTMLTKLVKELKNTRNYSYYLYLWNYSSGTKFFHAVQVIGKINFFQKLGFLIHPSRRGKYIVFIINSERMTTYLSDKRSIKNTFLLLRSLNLKIK